MHAILTKVHTMLDAHLGRCGKCIRQAFLAALGAWIFAVAAWAVAGRNGLTDAASVIAVGLTALWTAHLIAYAVRSFATSEGPQVSATKVTSRREVIPGFARALGLIALATVLPASSVLPRTVAIVPSAVRVKSVARPQTAAAVASPVRFGAHETATIAGCDAP